MVQVNGNVLGPFPIIRQPIIGAEYVCCWPGGAMHTSTNYMIVALFVLSLRCLHCTLDLTPPGSP